MVFKFFKGVPDIALSEKWANISEDTMLRVNEGVVGQTHSASDWKSNVGSNLKVSSNVMQRSDPRSAADSGCRGLTGQKAEVYIFTFFWITSELQRLYKIHLFSA